MSSTILKEDSNKIVNKSVLPEDYNSQKLKAQGEAVKEKSYFSTQNKLYDKKIVIADQIFAWAKAFKMTREYFELQNTSPEAQRFGAQDRLQIYAGAWGHARPQSSGIGQRSLFYITKDGNFAYLPGYDYLGTKQEDELVFKTPRDLAIGLSFDYLTDLHKSLYFSDGAVEFLMRKLKRG